MTESARRDELHLAFEIQKQQRLDLFRQGIAVNGDGFSVETERLKRWVEEGLRPKALPEAKEHTKQETPRVASEVPAEEPADQVGLSFKSSSSFADDPAASQPDPTSKDETVTNESAMGEGNGAEAAETVPSPDSPSRETIESKEEEEEAAVEVMSLACVHGHMRPDANVKMIAPVSLPRWNG